jgi:transposase
MEDATRLGLDVHKETIAVAILRPRQEIPDERIVANTPEALRSLVLAHRSKGGLVACYEAGPTGYDTHRQLTGLGVSCDVIAPALIPRRAGRRVKTDRLDARNLVRLHRAGELTAIRVPTPQEEALRDLIRVREDLKDDRRRTQQRVKGFLLRQGRRYPGSSRGWTDKYDVWVRGQHFDEPASEAAFRHYVAALDTRRTHLKAIDSEIEAAADRPPLAVPVARLRSFRGIDTLFAVTIATEVCDFRRFPSAASFMAFTGLVPSEHSSGPSERRGSITKTGNAHLRWALVEAAWAYRHAPAIGVELRRRNHGQPPDVQAYSWHAQCRLCSRFRRLAATKDRNVAVVAVARELAGFIWGLMTDRIAVP